MTRKQAAALQSLEVARAAYAAAEAALMDWTPTATDPRGELAEAAYDASRAAVTLAEDDLRALRAPRGYQCPHAAALASANID